MGIISIELPSGIAEILSDIEVPGEKIQESEMHVTLFYFDQDLTVQDISKIMETSYGLVSNTSPLNLLIDSIDSFPLGKDGIPIICTIQSTDLMKFRETLASLFDNLGVEYSRKFPEFKPHVTLSYSPTESKAKFKDPVIFTAESISLYGYETNINVNMSFKLSVMEKIAHDIVNAKTRKAFQI